MTLTDAPKAGALPDCATPRHAETLRLDAAPNATASCFDGNTRQNTAGTGNASPGIVPEDVAKAFSAEAGARLNEVVA